MLRAMIRTAVWQSPWTGTGFSVMAGRLQVAGMRTFHVPATPPTAFPAALVPGARRHVCRSIILSGLPGSHYFTTVIIYSSTEPSACGGALTLMSLTAGQEPHSGHINHQPRRGWGWGWGSLRPPREEIMLQTQRACQHAHFPWRVPPPGVSGLEELQHLCRQRN